MKTPLRFGLLLFVLALGTGLGAEAGPALQDGYDAGDLGLSFDAPGAPWARVGARDAAGGGREFAFTRPGAEEREVSLIAWQLERVPALAGLLDSELKQMRARGEVRELARDERRVDGNTAPSVRYRLEREGEPAVVIDATYFASELFLGRLAVTLPADEATELDDLVPTALAALHLGPRAAVPLVIDAPVRGNVVTVVRASSEDELARAYLEALPGAARAGDGAPVVLAVGDTLDAPTRAFLRKYRPGTIRLIGPAHPELPDARPVATESWPAGGTAVLSSADLGAAMQAACLAVRLGAPLLIDGGSASEREPLAERLAALRPARVLVLGDVAGVESPVPLEPLRGPADVARAAGGADYVALCNVGPGAGRTSAAVAACLAAARGGVVLPVDHAVTRHAIPLARTRTAPPGLEDVEGTGDYLVARFEAGGEEVLAGAAQTTVVRVATNDSPRYGRLRIDLNGDGRLAADEEPRIGSSVTLGGTTYHLTYHYGHAFVGYLSDELLLDELDPRTLQREVRELAAELGSAEFLAIVGTPARVPFAYEEAAGYFEAYDIKQELPSDAPYANLDEDAYLELAVGRLPVEDLVDGSAFVATTLAYERLAEADWSRHATLIQPGFAELEGALPWVLPNAEALIRGIEGDLVHAGIEPFEFYRDQVAMDDVLAAMSGSGWIAYFNHSGPGTWGIHPGASIVTGPSQRASDRSLPDLDGAPIVFGGGCSSAALDVGQPLERTFPGRFFELGAVAYLGNTRVAYARSEDLVQPFFARLASGESTLGQAYRDGRNLLSHLLEGGYLVGPLDEGVELGVRDFLHGQDRILNLFGDPALRPSLPPSAAAPVEVELAATADPGRLRLTVTNRGHDRRDPVQMMPAAGQGEPREFFVRTGPGMTASHLPYQFVEEGLSPVRSVPEVLPGAWVDVALPAGARDVRVTRVSGPAFADRGFGVLPGARGEPRLLMYVPLVRATFEEGDGEVARRVAFDVAFERGAEGAPVVRQREPRLEVEEPWSPPRASGTRFESGARKLLAKVRRRHGHALPPRGTAPESWSLANPQPRFYGEAAHFVGSWDADGRAYVEARDLPPLLRPRTAELVDAAREVAELAFRSPMPSLEGMRVELEAEGVLVLTPLGEDEGGELTRVELREDGTIERIVRRQFGILEETRFEWLETDRGPLLSRRARRDPVRPEKEVVHEVRYDLEHEPPRPRDVTLEITGLLPRPARFEFSYAERP